MWAQTSTFCGVSPVVHPGSTGIIVAQEKVLGERLIRRTYTVMVERDPKSDWLVGEVVELPGFYSQTPDLPIEGTMQDASMLSSRQQFWRNSAIVCGHLWLKEKVKKRGEVTIKP